MIVLDVKQGSPEWTQARLGIPTASKFDRILTPKTRKLSGSAQRYMCELIAERMTGFPADEMVTDFMARGTALEATAASAYEFERDVETRTIGFCLDDSRRWGASPDRLVGEDGLLEIKCPSAPVHVSALLGMATDDHALQVHGQLWVTGRQWADLMFYNPSFPTVIVRVERDEQLISELSFAVERFCDSLDKAWERVSNLQPRMAGAAWPAARDGRDTAASVATR